MKNHYIQAVLEMIKEGNDPDVVISGLAKLLEAKGHQSLFTSVVKGVLRVMEAQSERTGAVVTLTKAADEQKYVESIKASLKEMGADSAYQVKEDDTLIGGYIAEVNNTMHDQSHKSALIELYRKLTK